MVQKLTVVVAGSTGKQGGAVARALLERGHKVRAVTRDPNSTQAQSLANAGATLVAASLDDTAAIKKALDVIRQRMGEDAVNMYEWFDRVGFTVDRAALQREFPDVALQDFKSWAKTQDWNALVQSA